MKPNLLLNMPGPLGIICLLLAFLFNMQHLHAQEMTQTAIVVMVDVSKSFFPLSSDTVSALRQTANALITKADQDWEHPASFLWSTIGEPTRLLYPCGEAIQYVPGLMLKNRKKDSHIRTSLSEVRAWHEACLLRLSGKGIQSLDATFLSAAINLAGQSMETVLGTKILVLVSDFEEALPKGFSPSPFKLSGENVVLLFGLNQKDNGKDDLARERTGSWEKRIRQAGASHVCIVPIRVLQPGRVRQCLDSFDERPAPAGNK